MPSWSQRWHIASRDRWLAVLDALARMPLVFDRHGVEIVVRRPRVEKTDDQRRHFHAVAAEIGQHLGMTPGQSKTLIKEEFYGVEIREVLGVERRFVQSTEDSDREEYARLIDFAYQLAAEQGIVVADRRKRR